jgi:hypothetical protein
MLLGAADADFCVGTRVQTYACLRRVLAMEGSTEFSLGIGSEDTAPAKPNTRIACVAVISRDVSRPVQTTELFLLQSPDPDRAIR